MIVAIYARYSPGKGREKSTTIEAQKELNFKKLFQYQSKHSLHHMPDLKTIMTQNVN